jgi:GAF domain-containing protein
VIDVVLRRLKCSRVSLWRFDGVPGSLCLLCFASKVAGQDLVTIESRLLEQEYGAYFDRMVCSGTYVSVDAMSDPHLQPMRDNYLVPNHVRSMLDAAFMVNGRAYGMVCCEQTDAIRDWHSEEVAQLRAIVAKLAMLMTSARDEVLWATPSRPMMAIQSAKESDAAVQADRPPAADGPERRR